DGIGVDLVTGVQTCALPIYARIRELGIYNATVKAFDGTLGWNAHAPYDGILVAAGGPQVPDPLIAQLKTGGRLVIPIGETRESRSEERRVGTEAGARRGAVW